MSEPATGAESPLHPFLRQQAGPRPANAGVLLAERACRGHLALRGDGRAGDFRDAVARATGLELPAALHRFTARAEDRIFAIGPDEWLVILRGGAEGEVERRLRAELTGHFSVVDVSGGQTLLNLSGECAGTVLKKSCVYDFHPRDFPPGRCAQTVFAAATALVAANADGSFDLVVRRSYADYVAQWIAAAGAEHGIAFGEASTPRA